MHVYAYIMQISLLGFWRMYKQFTNCSSELVAGSKVGQQLWGCFKTPLWRAEARARCDTSLYTPAEQQNSPSSAASASLTSPFTPPRVAGTSQGNLHWYWSSRRRKLLWIAKGHRAAVAPPDFAELPSCLLSLPHWDEEERKLSTYLSFLIMCICSPLTLAQPQNVGFHDSLQRGEMEKPSLPTASTLWEVIPSAARSVWLVHLPKPPQGYLPAKHMQEKEIFFPKLHVPEAHAPLNNG